MSRSATLLSVPLTQFNQSLLLESSFSAFSVIFKFISILFVCLFVCLFVLCVAILLSQLLVAPTTLCVDWSGDSIDLVHDFSDKRIGLIVLFYIGLIYLVYLTEFWNQNQSNRAKQFMSCFMFLVIPFLLSSNIFIVVGFMKVRLRFHNRI
jgi:hypothetical protein